jgi:hypothetical protein
MYHGVRDDHDHHVRVLHDYVMLLRDSYLLFKYF